MTDRVSSLTVVLDIDIRIDDLEAITNAIKMIKHVVAVEPNIVDRSKFVVSQRMAAAYSSLFYKLAASSYEAGFPNDYELIKKQN